MEKCSVLSFPGLAKQCDYLLPLMVIRGKYWKNVHRQAQQLSQGREGGSLRGKA